ncbi:hypothetical protein HYY70_06035 [Candidatus Woesearchaeota archaeon]|nr:hypothetical protein [Candidatus Woesearchaeota archaeon]
MDIETVHESKEAEILLEIKEAEKKADEIMEKARRERESIIQEATRNSSKLLEEKQEEIRKLQEKKTMGFNEKAELIRKEKLAEGKSIAKQTKIKTEKNVAKAVEFMMKKFEEMI